MRNAIALTAAILLCVATASAAPVENLRLTLFGSDVGYAGSDNKGGGWSGGAGIAASYNWSPTWSVELAVAAEDHRLLLTRFVPADINGQQAFAPATFFETHRTYPVDLVAKYSFVNATRWSPFAGFGYHHVSAPNTHPSQVHIPVLPVGPGIVQTVHESSFPDSNDAEVIAGLTFRMTQRLSLEGGVRRLLTNGRLQDRFDPLTRAIVGITWKF